MNKDYIKDTVSFRKNNKKGAYFAMCASTLLLFILSYLPNLFSYLFVEFLVKNYVLIERSLVSLLCHFDVSVPMSQAAVRSLFETGIVYEFITIIIVIVSMAIPAIIFSAFVRLDFETSFKWDGKIIKGLFAFFCINQLITNFATDFSQGMYDYIVPPSPEVYTGSFTASSPNIFSLIINLLCTGILVPVVEEYVYRGVFFTYLRRYGLAFAIVASATLFGVAHSAPTQSVFAFAFGIISALAYVATGNIKTSILLHALNNIKAVLFGHLTVWLGRELFYLFTFIYTIIIITVAFSAFFRFTKQGGFPNLYFEKEKENDSDICVKAGMREVLCFPLIVFILFYAVDFISQVM